MSIITKTPARANRSAKPTPAGALKAAYDAACEAGDHLLSSCLFAVMTAAKDGTLGDVGHAAWETIERERSESGRFEADARWVAQHGYPPVPMRRTRTGFRFAPNEPAHRIDRAYTDYDMAVAGAVG